MTLVLIGVWAFFWRVEGRWFNTFFQQIHLALQDSEIQLLLEVHWLPSTPRCFFQSLESQLVVLLMQEIPNNHLGCIPKPQKIMGWSNKLNWWTQDFWSINSIFRKKSWGFRQLAIYDQVFVRKKPMLGMFGSLVESTVVLEFPGSRTIGGR